MDVAPKGEGRRLTCRHLPLGSSSAASSARAVRDGGYDLIYIVVLHAAGARRLLAGWRVVRSFGVRVAFRKTFILTRSP